MIPSLYLPLLDTNALIPQDVRALDDQIGVLLHFRRTHKHDLIMCRGAELKASEIAAELRMIEKALAARLVELDRHVLETADRICDERFAKSPDRCPTVTAIEVIYRMYGQPMHAHKFPKTFRSYFTTGRTGKNVRVYRILRGTGRYVKQSTKTNSTIYARIENEVPHV